jgi:hypothetical protein
MECYEGDGREYEGGWEDAGEVREEVEKGERGWRGWRMLVR